MISTNTTYEVFKENLPTVLDIFPNSFIRPCNKNRFGSPIPTDRKSNHFAHYLITPILSENPTNGFKEYGAPLPFYITRGTWDDHGDKYIFLRLDLIERWLESGWANVFWFIEGTDLFACLTSDEIRNEYRSAMTNHRFADHVDRNGVYWRRFYIDKKYIHRRAKEMPKNTTFKEEYIEGLRYIELTSYSKYRNIKGTIYAVIMNDSGEVQMIKNFTSLKQIWENTPAIKDKITYRGFTKKVAAGQIVNCYDGAAPVYFTYAKEEVADIETAQSTVDALMKKCEMAIKIDNEMIKFSNKEVCTYKHNKKIAEETLEEAKIETTVSFDPKTEQVDFDGLKETSQKPAEENDITWEELAKLDAEIRKRRANNHLNMIDNSEPDNDFVGLF